MALKSVIESGETQRSSRKMETEGFMLGDVMGVKQHYDVSLKKEKNVPSQHNETTENPIEDQPESVLYVEPDDDKQGIPGDETPQPNITLDELNLALSDSDETSSHHQLFRDIKWTIIIIITKAVIANNRYYTILLSCIKRLKEIRAGSVFTDNSDDGIILLTVGHLRVPDVDIFTTLTRIDAPDGLKPGVLKRVTSIHARRITKIVEASANNNRQFFRLQFIVRMKNAYPYPARPVLSPDDKTMQFLQEILEDHTTHLRQHLFQLYGLANVQIVSIEDLQGNKPGKFILELRPTQLQKLRPLVKAIDDHQITNVLCNELKKMPGNFLRGKEIITWVDQNQINRLYIQEEERKRMIGNAGHQPNIDSSKLQTDGPSSESVPITFSQNITLGHPRPSDRKKSLIVLSIFEKTLSNNKSTPDELLKVLRCHPEVVLEVRNSKGYGLLHMLVEAQRGDLLSAVVYSNLWDELRASVVEIPYGTTGLPSHYGYTPRRLAESISIKGRGYKILVEYDKHEEIIIQMNPLNKLCLQGNLPLIREYVKVNNKALNQADETGHTPLLAACGAGQTEIVMFLMSQGASTDVITNQKAGCLHLACKFGHVELLRYLMTRGHWDIGLVDSSGYASVEYAAMNGDIESLRIWTSKYNLTGRCLVLATQYKRDNVVDYLLDDYKQDPNQGHDEEGRTALCHAVINNDAKSLKKLLDHGADIKVRDIFGKNVLHLVSHHSHVSVVEIILEVAREKGCLDELVRATDVFVGHDLLQIIRGKDKKRRAWHWVELHRHLLHSFNTKMASGKIDVARYGTIQHCGFGFAPNEASKQKMEELKKERLEKAQPDMTPLLVAVNRENVDIVKIFLDNGADPNKTDHFGLSPAHLAAMRGNLEILKMLEKAGGKLDLTSKEGYTPEQIAEENSHMVIINFLQAENTMQHALKFINRMKETKMSLGDSILEMERSKGRDIRRYLIETLRELTIDINTALLGLESGPVMEESIAHHSNTTSSLA